MKTIETIQDAKQCLEALGGCVAWRLQRLLRQDIKSQLQDIEFVLDGEMTAQAFMNKHGIIRDSEYNSLFKWRDW